MTKKLSFYPLKQNLLLPHKQFNQPHRATFPAANKNVNKIINFFRFPKHIQIDMLFAFPNFPIPWNK